MKILCLTHYFPFPPDSGGAIRVHGLLRALGSGHTAHLLTIRRNTTTGAELAQAERELGVSVEAFAVQPAEGGSRAGRWVHALSRRTPPWVTSERSPALAARAAALAEGFDVVVILDDYAGVYAADLRALPAAPPIVADKPVVLGALAAAGAARRGAAARMRDLIAAPLTRSFERRYLRQVDATVVTSPEEAERYERLYGARPTAVVASAIDLPAEVRLDSRSRAVGFVGSLEARPIADGLCRFVESAWAELGGDGFELLVAGRDPPPAVVALERHEGVRLLGYVPELDEFLARLRAAVIPLWGGQGIKLKTLTLLGAGLPTVATPVALEGVPAADGQECLIAEEPAELARALTRILSDDRLARALGAGARRLVEERFTWERVGPDFVEVVERAAAGRAR